MRPSRRAGPADAAGEWAGAAGRRAGRRWVRWCKAEERCLGLGLGLGAIWAAVRVARFRLFTQRGKW
ncbi:hypothetical protein GCM10010452_14650 [Crossiella cryophila]